MKQYRYLRACVLLSIGVSTGLSVTAHVSGAQKVAATNPPDVDNRRTASDV